MVTADLIREARLRGGLTQAELARRLRRPQSTVARWERGQRLPSLETTRDVIRACGLDLGFGLARYDDSYQAVVDAQLALAPAERVRRQSPDDDVGDDAVAALLALGGAEFVLVGQIAEVLRGSPVALPSPPARLELLVADADSARSAWARALLQTAAVADVVDELPGTAGLPDLARDASPLELAPACVVRVASLRDLVRIAEAAPEHHARVPALRVTLERSSRP